MVAPSRMMSDVSFVSVIEALVEMVFGMIVMIVKVFVDD